MPGTNFVAQPVVTGGGRIITSPFQFATTEDDNLRIESTNSVPFVVITIQGRRLNEKGVIEFFSYTHQPNSDRSLKTQDYKLGAGALLNLTIVATNASPKIGQTFVSARFIRGLTGATLVLGTLLQGYITGAQHLGYPGSPIQTSIEGGGVVRAITGSAPALGAQFNESVPTGARWQLLSLLSSLTTSAVAGARNPSLTMVKGGQIFVYCAHPKTLAAGASQDYAWAVGVQRETTPPNLQGAAALPADATLLAGDTLSAYVANFDAGDRWTAPIYVVREWLEVTG